MSLTSSQLNALKSLSCFEEVIDISLLADGMSHTCITVTTPSQTFFVKKLNSETARDEILSSQYAAKNRLSPRVIYHDNTWLVTEFIEGITLDKTERHSSKCIAIGLSLMAKLHQLKPLQNTIPYLETSKSVQSLFTNPASIPARQRHILKDVTKMLTFNIESLQSLSDTDIVLCHGDINYSNIMIDQAQKAWLIDFECAHLAPIEFDLAMFIAVNNISPFHISKIVDNYVMLVPSYRPNSTLLTYYILYSFFINGLWYFDHIDNKQSKSLFEPLAIAQWTAFDSLAIKHAIDIPKLMPLTT